MKEEYYRIEEEFLAESQRSFRKDRKEVQGRDRSKYKKSDRDKRVIASPPEGTERGRVLAIHGQEITVQFSTDSSTICHLKGSLKQEKTDKKNLITIGDFVWVDSQALINYVEERYSVLSRADNLHHRKEQIIAANIDQVLITTSIVCPEIRPSLIDRYIIAAQRGGMDAVVLINKIDLSTDPVYLQEFKKTYESLGIPCLLISTLTGEGLSDLTALLQGKSSVFAGQSGVGKSSLINKVTGSALKTGELIDKTQKGAHTTSHATLIPIGHESFCIDTPGIRSFSLWDITEHELLSYFTDLQESALHCKFINCTHRHEPGCAVKEAVESGKLSSLRYHSYINIREDYDKDLIDTRS